MFLSKIWFVLVAVVAGLATTAAFVAPRSADRRIAELEGQRLDRAQYATEQMLKTDAHRFIDYAASLSRDALLAESLDAASRGVGEAKTLNETVKLRLRALTPNLTAIGVESLAALDTRGRLVARVGERENEFGDSLAGAEVVADALRGYLSDDVWGAGGKVQRMAAVPVLAKSRDHIVGVLLVAAETGKRLTDLWKRNLEVDVAILTRGQVASSTLPEAFLTALPGLIDDHREEIREAKRTRALNFAVGNDRYIAVAAPFAGQAAEQGGYYVLIGKKSPASSPLLLLTTVTADDLKFANFPWIGLGVALLALLGVGLWLQRKEMEKPLGTLRAEVQRLARGEIQKLPDTQFAGKFGGIARDMNAAIERYTHAAPARPDVGRRDSAPAPSAVAAPAFDLSFRPGMGGMGSSGSSLAPSSLAPPFGGMPAPSGMSTFGGTTPAPISVGPPPITNVTSSVFLSTQSAPAPVAPAQQGLGRPGAGPPAPAPLSESRPPLSPASALGAMPQARLVSPALPPGGGMPPKSLPIPLAALGLAGAPPGARPLPQDLPALPATRVAPLTAPLPATRVVEIPGALVAESMGNDPANTEPVSLQGQVPAAESARGESSDGFGGTPRERPRDPARPDTTDPEEEHVRDVFADYVATRERCGEPTTNLTLEKFRAKLDANRQALVAKYQCRTARFSVYVKEGKAAIKASPQR